MDGFRIPINERSLTLRFLVVAVLVAALMIPLALVGALVVGEREQQRQQAVASIASAWGREQNVAGPVVLVPVEERSADQTARLRPGEAARHVAVMPSSADIRLKSRYEVRQRGIFEVPAFHLDIAMDGVFEPLDEAKRRRLEAEFGSLRFDQAVVVVHVADPRGIRAATLAWNGETLPLSTVMERPIDGGLRAEPFPGLAAGGEVAVSLSLRGTERFTALPVADRTRVEMASTWPHPSFDGRLLPDRHDVSDGGFTASWTTLDLARGFPSASGIESLYALAVQNGVGFRVFEPVNVYTLVSRSTRYGVLFIALTLVGVLCLELAAGVRFHFVQYGVAGVALVLFFLTLLALAEHVGFAAGYAAAATLLTVMIAWYAHGTTRTWRLTALVAGTLAALYAVLYALLRLETYALLVGTLVLLAALALVMLVTRRVAPSPVES